MAKSSHLRLREVREAFRILGDCRELGRDRKSWVTRALEGIRDHTGSLVVIGGFIESSIPDPSQIGRSQWDVGWLSPGDRAAWLSLLRSGRHYHYETVQKVTALRGRVVVRSRDQLVDSADWSRSAEFNEDRRPLSQDDTMIGLSYLAPDSGIQLFSVNRAVGDRGFDARDRAFLRLFLVEVRALLHTHLAVTANGPIDRLPPRLKAVLEAIAAGDTEKQVACRLGLSRHTVHDYVKELHRRVGASCRAELLAFYHKFRS